MGLTVVLNATEGRVQVLIAEAETESAVAQDALCVLDWQAAKGAMEVLTPLLEQALCRLGRPASDICQVAAVCGPGSFTGLRLATATAQGLAEAVHAPMAGLNYLHCLAQSLPAAPSERVRVLTRAGDLIYTADYCPTEVAGLPMRCVQPLRLCHPENVLEDILKDILEAPREKNHSNPGQTFWLTGSACFPLIKNGRLAPDPLAALHAQLKEIPAHLRLAPPSFCQPSPAALLCLARHAEWSFNDLNPIYLRACDAEKNLEHMARQRGQDPLEAYQALRQLTEKKF